MSILKYLDDLGSQVKTAASDILGVDVVGESKTPKAAPEKAPDQTAALPNNKLPVKTTDFFQNYKTPILVGGGLLLGLIALMAVRK